MRICSSGWVELYPCRYSAGVRSLGNVKDDCGAQPIKPASDQKGINMGSGTKDHFVLCKIETRHCVGPDFDGSGQTTIELGAYFHCRWSKALSRSRSRFRDFAHAFYAAIRRQSNLSKHHEMAAPGPSTPPSSVPPVPPRSPTPPTPYAQRYGISATYPHRANQSSGLHPRYGLLLYPATVMVDPRGTGFRT